MNGRDTTAPSESPIYEGKKVHQVKVAFINLVGWNCVEVDRIAVTWAITRIDFIPNLQNVLIGKRSEERNRKKKKRADLLSTTARIESTNVIKHQLSTKLAVLSV
jgi:hypothetical protein